jgi:hypothetical protein
MSDFHKLGASLRSFLDILHKASVCDEWNLDAYQKTIEWGLYIEKNIKQISVEQEGAINNYLKSICYSRSHREISVQTLNQARSLVLTTLLKNIWISPLLLQKILIDYAECKVSTLDEEDAYLFEYDLREQARVEASKVQRIKGEDSDL